MIGTNAELGLAGTSQDGQARTSFEEIVKATTRAKDVVRQILLFSRRQDSEREIIALQPVIEDAVKFLRATLPANVEFRTVVEPGVPRVSANASQVYQILMNLGTNAAHAMPQGGALCLGLGSCQLTASEATASALPRDGEYVRVIVQDTGTGMSREILDRIFEPFFTTKGTEGTGLGLSVVHGLVKDHGGSITVESEPGNGSTFRVYLPVARAEPAALPSEAASPDLGQGQNILYVDDEPQLGSAMTRVLTLLGYRCTFYADARTAIEAFRADPHQFDAAISDMTMPLLSGFDVIRELRAIRPDLPVALTSGRTPPQVHPSAANLGIDTWISKPATIDELGRALELLFAIDRERRRDLAE